MNKIKITGVHPYAAKFPMLPEPELNELAVSIEANGLRQPIVITQDGQILDGRNRYAACQQVSVQPEFVIYDGDDLAEYVIDANIARRNMSTGARAMATALVLVEDGRRVNGRWRRGSVRNGHESISDETAWIKALNRAGTVIDFRRELADQVVAGDLELGIAYRKSCETRDAEAKRIAADEELARQEAEAREFIETNAPDLAARVDGTDLLTFAEALSLWQQRNREQAERIAREKAEAKRKADEERKAKTHTYSRLAEGLEIVGSYGQYEDPLLIMNGFDWEYLHPPQLDRFFEIENLESAARFIDALIEWRKS